ncbi:hypothetical protein [Dictyobacter aurantiacus]|uniref:CBM56 domain-containing protein n=1 Tax=Dictyobacter aurantiacus TaxID=1936993 RepID=A0A401Z9F5_9CHLR|nr:hypothetical protein [Dictyobacter aurantiacus]GCE03472.1 hypothetical protein KDAU_08010 [Dictyobacter aurantiacus]
MDEGHNLLQVKDTDDLLGNRKQDIRPEIDVPHRQNGNSDTGELASSTPSSFPVTETDIAIATAEIRDDRPGAQMSAQEEARKPVFPFSEADSGKYQNILTSLREQEFSTQPELDTSALLPLQIQLKEGIETDELQVLATPEQLHDLEESVESGETDELQILRELEQALDLEMIDALEDAVKPETEPEATMHYSQPVDLPLESAAVAWDQHQISPTVVHTRLKRHAVQRKPSSMLLLSLALSTAFIGTLSGGIFNNSLAANNLLVPRPIASHWSGNAPAQTPTLRPTPNQTARPEPRPTPNQTARPKPQPTGSKPAPQPATQSPRQPDGQQTASVQPQSTNAPLTQSPTVPSAPASAPARTPSPPSPPVPSNSFTQGATSTSGTTALFDFTPNGWTAGYVILHYTAAGAMQQNVTMSNNGGNWQYTVGGLGSGTTITYSFTYQRDGVQYDTGSYSWTSAGSSSGSGFTQSVTRISAGAASFTFTPGSWTAGYVILHYTVAGSSQQNVTMSNNGGNWQYTVGGLNAGATITYSFTYQRDGVQYDTGSYSWMFP